MERKLHEVGVIELGTASVDTLGSPIPTPHRELIGFYPMGLLED